MALFGVFPKTSHIVRQPRQGRTSVRQSGSDPEAENATQITVTLARVNPLRDATVKHREREHDGTRTVTPNLDRVNGVVSDLLAGTEGEELHNATFLIPLFYQEDSRKNKRFAQTSHILRQDFYRTDVRPRRGLPVGNLVAHGLRTMVAVVTHVTTSILAELNINIAMSLLGAFIPL